MKLKIVQAVLQFFEIGPEERIVTVMGTLDLARRCCLQRRDCAYRVVGLTTQLRDVSLEGSNVAPEGIDVVPDKYEIVLVRRLAFRMLLDPARDAICPPRDQADCYH